jgi:predicted nucleic acid-binding protein
MRAVDTNVLVRLLTRDDAKQTASAETFVSKGAWVSHVVLIETVWALDSVFALEPSQIGVAIEIPSCSDGRFFWPRDSAAPSRNAAKSEELIHPAEHV